ncbi:dnc, partial [Symbiodinium sp. CCMP2592]
DEQFDVEVESAAEEPELDGQAWQLDFNSFGTGPVDVDMIFKQTLPRELPVGDDVLYISKEGAVPKIYPERGCFIHLAAHPVDVFCAAPPGCRNLYSGKRKICEALVKQGLQLAVPCVAGESLMLGMTKIPCKMFLAALEACNIDTVYVGHFGARWPCATIGDGVRAGVLAGLTSWHTGVDLACRLGDKTKILLLGFNIGDTSGVTNIPAFHPA